MKISELTDEACSRWIAETLEPLNKAKIHRINGHTYSNFWDAGEGWDGMPSADKFQPRDMVADPAMTLILIEKLSRHDIEISGREIDGRIYYICNKRLEPRLTIGRAIAEAWMKANGYEDGKD